MVENRSNEDWRADLRGRWVDDPSIHGEKSLHDLQARAYKDPTMLATASDHNLSHPVELWAAKKKCATSLFDRGQVVFLRSPSGRPEAVRRFRLEDHQSSLWPKAGGEVLAMLP